VLTRTGRVGYPRAVAAARVTEGSDVARSPTVGDAADGPAAHMHGAAAIATIHDSRRPSLAELELLSVPFPSCPNNPLPQQCAVPSVNTPHVKPGKALVPARRR